MSADEYKDRAAKAAAELVEDGMRVGLGTGSTVGFLLLALAERKPNAVYVATSETTEGEARELGLHVEPFGQDGELAELDIAIDGADQVAPDGWLVKGGGGAHTRERIVASAANRFVVIVSSDKLVERIHPPVPLELMRFGLSSTIARLGDVHMRVDTDLSPDGGVIADLWEHTDDLSGLAARLKATPGVVDHGLFPPEMVSLIIECGPEGVRSYPPGGRGT